MTISRALVLADPATIALRAPPPPPNFDDGFEFSDGWPETVANTNPQPTFTTPTTDDGFENADGWPGT